jgi:hypothetical protein
MSGGYFKLEPGEVLLLEMPSTPAQYQAIQLTDMWMASLEHANQVSSLATSQSVLAPDESYYYVISREDPGYANWLDAGELARGTFLMRWDAVRGALTEGQYPSARLLQIEDLEAAIPGFSVVSAEQRAQVRRDRRLHLQLRSHR